MKFINIRELSTGTSLINRLLIFFKLPTVREFLKRVPRQSLTPQNAPPNTQILVRSKTLPFQKKSTQSSGIRQLAATHHGLPQNRRAANRTPSWGRGIGFPASITGWLKHPADQIGLCPRQRRDILAPHDPLDFFKVGLQRGRCSLLRAILVVASFSIYGPNHRLWNNGA